MPSTLTIWLHCSRFSIWQRVAPVLHCIKKWFYSIKLNFVIQEEKTQTHSSANYKVTRRISLFNRKKWMGCFFELASLSPLKMILFNETELGDYNIFQKNELGDLKIGWNKKGTGFWILFLSCQPGLKKRGSKKFFWPVLFCNGFSFD